MKKNALTCDRGDTCLFVRMLCRYRIFDSADLFSLDFFISSLNPLHVIFLPFKENNGNLARFCDFVSFLLIVFAVFGLIINSPSHSPASLCVRSRVLPGILIRSPWSSLKRQSHLCCSIDKR